MTTKSAEVRYEIEHRMRYGGLPVAVFNPHSVPVDALPVIYGFNNGGQPGLYHAVLIAEDGSEMGGHACSSEAYMPHDLGILAGTRPDRHKQFQEHYPDGYRMEFVSYDTVAEHAGLQAAFTAHFVSKE